MRNGIRHILPCAAHVHLPFRIGHRHRKFICIFFEFSQEGTDSTRSINSGIVRHIRIQHITFYIKNRLRARYVRNDRINITRQTEGIGNRCCASQGIRILRQSGEVCRTKGITLLGVLEVLYREDKVFTIGKSARIANDDKQQCILYIILRIIRSQIQRILTVRIQVAVGFVNRFSPVNRINLSDSIYGVTQVLVVLSQLNVRRIHEELHTLNEQRSSTHSLHIGHRDFLRRYERMEIEGDDRVFHRHTILEGNGVVPLHRVLNRVNQFVVITDGILKTAALAYINRDRIIQRITQHIRDQLCPDMGYLVRGEVNQHWSPTELLQEVTVDINRVLAFGSKGISLALGSQLIAIEIQISIEVVICLTPVIDMETEVTCIRNDDWIQIHMIPRVSTCRVDITVLPVEGHRVGTLVTGELSHIEFHLQLIIRLDTDISCNRILRDIAVKHTVHKSGLEGSNIKLTVGNPFDSLVDQFAQRLGTMTHATGFVDSTFAYRHLAIHLVLEGEGTLDGSLTIQFVCQRSVSGILVVILDHRDTNHIPMLLVVTRNSIFYVRNQQFGFGLVRIHRLRSIFAIELGSEIERVGSTDTDIEFYIAEAVNSLSRYVMRSALTFLNRAFAIVRQTVFLEHVGLGEQTFVNSYVHFGITCACVLGDDAEYFVIKVFVFLQISRIEFVPHLGISRLTVLLTHVDRKCVITGVSGEGLHKFSLEPEVTGTYRTGDTDNDRVFLQELVERAGRNGIRIVLACCQFLALGHHVLNNRECERSLRLVGILSSTDIPKMGYRFYLLVQITDFFYLRLRDDIPRGIFRLGIEAVPLQHFERDTPGIDRIKRLNGQGVSPEAERGSTLEVNINNTVLESLEYTVLHCSGLLCVSSQREILNRRSSRYRALIGELDNTLAGGIVFVQQVETQIITAFHHFAQIHGVPEVLIGFLRVTGNPVERDSGRAAGTLSLFGQTDLDRELLGRMNLEEHLITLDILE